MLLLVIISIIILVSILVLHFTHHFRLYICNIPSPRLPEAITINSNSTSHFDTKSSLHRLTLSQMHFQRNRKKCACKIAVIDDEDFNFFPNSFLLYIIFIIFLCLLISINEILTYYINSETINQLLFHFTFQSKTDNKYIDYILIYGVMIMSLWESLFTFYRFYTTLKTTTSLILIESTIVIQRFSIYAVLFGVLYIIDIHFCHSLFPIIIFVNVTFNIYCNWKWSALLITQYQEYNANSDGLSTKTIIDMFKRIYFIRRISFICTLLQFVYLSVFVITQNIDTIYYFPILWSINAAVYSLNFARNRAALKCISKTNKPIPSALYTSDSKIPSNPAHIKCQSMPIINIHTNTMHSKQIEAEQEGNQLSLIEEMEHKMPEGHPIISERPKTSTDVVNLKKSDNKPAHKLLIFKKKPLKPSLSHPILSDIDIKPNKTKSEMPSNQLINFSMLFTRSSSENNISRKDIQRYLKETVSAPAKPECMNEEIDVVIGNQETENKYNLDSIELVDSSSDDEEKYNLEMEIKWNRNDNKHITRKVKSLDVLIKYGFYTENEVY